MSTWMHTVLLMLEQESLKYECVPSETLSQKHDSVCVTPHWGFKWNEAFSWKLQTLKAMIVFNIESRLSLSPDDTCSTAERRLVKPCKTGLILPPAVTTVTLSRLHAACQLAPDHSTALTQARQMQTFLHFSGVIFTAIRSNGVTWPEHTSMPCSIHPHGF